MPRTQPELLSTADAADFLNVHRDTLLRWEAAGRIKAVRPGGPTSWRKWRLADLERLLRDEGSAA